MRLCTTTIALLLLLACDLFAQRENDVWCFGAGAGIDFSSGAPVVTSGNAMQSYEGCASIADRTTGELLFYTNGNEVWNSFDQLMPNGTGLGGHLTSTQSALIVPMPGSPHRYYIFSADAGVYDSPPNDGIRYSVVDMRLDGGRGAIVEKGRELVTSATEKLTAVPMSDGKGYWIVTTSRVDNALYAFAVTGCRPSEDPVVRRVGLDSVDRPSTYEIGYLKASPDGRRLAAATQIWNVVQVYDFDPQTGIASNAIRIDVGLPYGLSFSPSGDWLYIGDLVNNVVLRYDARARDQASMLASRQVVAGSLGLSVHAMQVAPDGRIYCSIQDSRMSTRGAPFIGVIDDPDGASPRLISNALGLGGATCYLGLPNMIVSDVKVEVEEVVAEAGEDRQLCPGDTVQLQGSGNGALRWEPGDVLSCHDCAEPRAWPRTTTTFRLFVTSDGNCIVTDSMTVHVSSPPQLEVFGDTSICSGGSALLRASATTGEPGKVSYRWSPSDGLACDTCAAITVSPLESTTYRVVAVTERGCAVVDSVRVAVVDAGFVEAGEPQTICAGDSVRLMAVGGASWRWSPSDGLSCEDCPDPVARPGKTTTYRVTVPLPDGCSAVDTVTVTVVPSITIDAGSDLVLCGDDSVQLVVEGGSSYRWSPALGLSCDDCPNPLASPSVTTMYTITATSADGCIAYDSVLVEVLPAGTIHAHIPRDQHVAPGDHLDLPILIDAPITVAGIDTLLVSVWYDTSMVRLEDVILDGTLLDGWNYTLTQLRQGHALLQLGSQHGELRGAGPLLRLRLRAYLGSERMSVVGFQLTVPGNRCITASMRNGSLVLDSLCGLDYRLFEFGAAKYSLAQNVPNPFNPITIIRFSTAFDGPVRLEVFDAAGDPIATLLDRTLAAGTHQVEWQATDVPPGLYTCRMTAGSWSATRQMILVK